MNASTHGAPASRGPLDVTKIALDGIHLIEASAGTGKTYTITSLLLRLLVERELDIESIVAVTFTNAATGELRERVGKRIAQALDALTASPGSPDEDAVVAHLRALPDQARVEGLLRGALTDVDRASVFTIHGLAQRLLRDHAFESGARLEVELIGDSSRVAYDAVVDFWSLQVARLSPFEFRALGGASLLRELEQVAQEATAQTDIELVELPPEVEIESSLLALDLPFARAKEIFLERHAEAVTVLGSKQVHQGWVKAASVAADVEHLKGLFAAGDARVRPASSIADRWTRDGVLQRATKGNKPTHPVFDVFQEWLDAWAPVDAAVAARRAHLRAALVHFVRARVVQLHRRARTQSFDDLLLDLRAALRDPERGATVARAIREEFPVALIDEFQDTDPVQYEIFQRIYGAPDEGGALYLIGDPKQSIYSFRGADVFSYLKAGADAVNGTWTLGTSYRSGPAVVAAQNALFGGLEHPFLVPGISYEPLDTPPSRTNQLVDSKGRVAPGIWVGEAELAKNEFFELTARQIAEWLDAGWTLRPNGEANDNDANGERLGPRHIAVLTRTNAQAQRVQASLRRLGIPAVMHGDRSVFEAREALELRRILVALLEPGQKRKVRAALASRFLGLDVGALFELDTKTELLELWTTRFRTWSEQWRTRGLVYAMQRLVEETGLTARTLREVDGERRMTNFRHLLEILHQAEATEHWGPTGLLRFLEAAIADPLGHAMALDARQLRLESDHDAVTLTTLHKSKGLEYEVVFLPTLGSMEGARTKPAFRYRDPERGTGLLEVREGDERRETASLAFVDQCAEDLRLAYVGLTRPKHLAVVLTPPFLKKSSKSSAQFSPLAYLVHGKKAPAPGDEAFAKYVEQQSSAASEEEWSELIERSAGTITRTKIDLDAAPLYRRDAAIPELRARPLPTAVPDSAKTRSFSSLTKTAHGEARSSRASREGRDVDEVSAEVSPHAATSPLGTVGLERVVLADFPRGAGPGEALHTLFEFSPFADGDAAARRAVVDERLVARGVDLTFAPACHRMLEDVLDTALDGETLRLGALTPRARRAELEFSLPVGSLEARLSARRLALALGYVDRDDAPPDEVFTAPTTSLSQAYLTEVARLPFPAWSGYLRGFIDLVFEDRGRLYVVDYKSNHLGDQYGDYSPPRLERAMDQHHYHLQALFYALAVHRHGQRRMPGYSYEESFGGVYYLFLRGMKPGSKTGIHFLRPTESEMNRLSALFTDPTGVTS